MGLKGITTSQLRGKRAYPSDTCILWVGTGNQSNLFLQLAIWSQKRRQTGATISLEGPSTQDLRTLIPKTIPSMAFGTRVLTLLQINMEVERSPLEDYCPLYRAPVGFHVNLGEGKYWVLGPSRQDTFRSRAPRVLDGSLPAPFPPCGNGTITVATM